MVNVPFSGNYWNSTSRAPATGTPFTFSKGGLCPEVTSGAVFPCQNTLAGVIGPYTSATNTIPMIPAAISGQYYELKITVSDIISNTPGSYYEVAVDGVFAGSTPTVTVGGAGPHSSGTITVIMSDGGAPATHVLGITNGYMANTASPVFPANSFQVSVTEVALAPPAPASLAIAALTFTSVTASWAAVTTPPLIATSYALQYAVTGTGMWTTITGITSLSQVVTGLTPGTIYDFEVASIDSLGFIGPYSSIVHYTVPPSTNPLYPNLIGLSFDVVKSPLFAVAVNTAKSGREIRTSYSKYPKWKYTLTYTYLPDFSGNGTTASDLKTLMGFFLLVWGTQTPFVFMDPDDNFVAAQAIGTTDGTTTDFVLMRTYGLGTSVGTEPVGYVDSSALPIVYLNGVAQSTSTWSLISGVNTLQLIRFNTAPTAGQTLTVDMHFLYKAKFLADQIDFDKFANKFWESGKVEFQTYVSAGAP